MGPYYDHQVGRFERPDPVRERDILLARARRARAEAAREVLGAVYRGLKAAGSRVAGLVRHAGAGAALRAPHDKPSPLTGCCN